MTETINLPYVRRDSSERAVLGAALIDPACIGVVMAGTSEDEFDGHYRTIYKAVRKAFDSGDPVDVVTVGAILGPNYNSVLMQLMQETPTAANVEVYIRILREQSVIARAQELGAKLSEAGDADECRALIDAAAQLLAERPGRPRRTAAELVSLFYSRMDEKPVYLDWGIERLNENVYAEAGDFVVIGGRPSAGKTALSIQCACEMAKTKHVGYYSLETNDYKFCERMIAHLTGLDMRKIKRHQYCERDYATVYEHAEEIGRLGIEFIHAAGMTVSEIRSDSLSRRYDIIFVDYLQIIESGLKKAMATEQVRAISRDLHMFSQSTGTTVVALAQLNRPDKSEGEEKAPTMTSLKESGQIEQDADAIIFIYKTEPNKADSPRMIKIGKNKDGTLGAFQMDFDGASQTFREPQKSSFREDNSDEELPAQFSIDGQEGR